MKIIVDNVSGLRYLSFMTVRNHNNKGDEMKGTEKQIAWAEQIIEGWKSQVDTVIAEARGRVERNTMPQEWADIMTDIGETAKANMANFPTAAQVIDSRKLNIGQTVFDGACKIYSERIKA